ncbi:hypothetical protein B0H11DRAFT_2216819 [Mycena galericulata]|nr:hypothetical protein B0H11DRAFT_2216819 [Mycena galericulata]
MSHDVSQVFAAVYQAVYSPENPEDIPHSNEVINDIEGEGETIPDAEQDETNENTSPPVVFNISQLQEHLLEAPLKASLMKRTRNIGGARGRSSN